MYFSFRIHVQTQTHTSVDLSFLRMRYGHLYGNAQWPFSSLAFSSLSHLCTVETKQRASTEGAQIRLFKWIGHYTGDAWGYRQKNTITWYLPAFLLSNHSFHLCSTLSAGIHFLRPQSWQITGGGDPAPKSFPWKSLWLQFSNHWSDPTCEWESDIVNQNTWAREIKAKEKVRNKKQYE